MQFKEFGNNVCNNCDGMVLPENWTLESVYSNDKFIVMTFGIALEANTRDVICFSPNDLYAAASAADLNNTDIDDLIREISKRHL